MGIHWVCGELNDCFASSAGVTESTVAGHFDNTAARLALDLGVVQLETIQSVTLAELVTDSWLHFEAIAPYAASSSGGSVHGFVTWYRATGEPIVRLAVIGVNGTIANRIQVQYWTTTPTPAWTAAGSVLELPPQSLGRHDIRLTVNAAGSSSLTWHIGGAEVLTASWTSTYSTGVAFVQLGKQGYAVATQGQTKYSQIIWSSEDTRAMRLITVTASGAGEYSEGTGSYLDVNETPLNDLTGWVSNSSGERLSWTINAPGSSVQIRAVVVSARASRSVGGPQSLKTLMRAGTTDYESAEMPLTTGLEPHQTILAADPATGASWALGSLTGRQIGLKSGT